MQRFDFFFLNMFMISVWSKEMPKFIFTSVIFVIKLHQKLSFLNFLPDFQICW